MIKYRFKMVVPAIIVLVMLLSSACGSSQPANSTNAAATVTFGVLPDLNSIPFMVAKQQGYFGDNVKLELYRSPTDRESALQSGNLDGAIGDMLGLFLFKQGGFDVFAPTKTDGRYGIVTHPDSGVSDLSELNGKSVALVLNTIIEYVTDVLVLTEGGDPGSIEKTIVPQIPSRLELLASQQVDAAAMPEPFITAARESGMIVLAVSDEYQFNPSIALFMMDTLNNKGDELRDFFDAYNKAVDYINSTDSDEFMPAAIEALGLPADAINVELPVYERYALPDEAEFDSAMKWLLEKGLITQEYSYDELVKNIY